MNFKFNEGDCVALKQDNPILELSAGSIGTIWVCYTTNPPMYDVTFKAKDGTEFDGIYDEDELELVERPASVEFSAHELTAAKH